MGFGIVFSLVKGTSRATIGRWTWTSQPPSSWRWKTLAERPLDGWARLRSSGKGDGAIEVPSIASGVHRRDLAPSGSPWTRAGVRACWCHAAPAAHCRRESRQTIW